jgi:hypothetical protein
MERWLLSGGGRLGGRGWPTLHCFDLQTEGVVMSMWMGCKFGREEKTYGEDGEGLCVDTHGVLVEEGEVEGPSGVCGRGLCFDDHGGLEGGLEGGRQGGVGWSRVEGAGWSRVWSARAGQGRAKRPMADMVWRVRIVYIGQGAAKGTVTHTAGVGKLAVRRCGEGREEHAGVNPRELSPQGAHRQCVVRPFVEPV